MTLTQNRPVPHQGKQIKRALNIMPSRFTTPYDSNRDQFYGLEKDPVTGRIYDCRDRD